MIDWIDINTPKIKRIAYNSEIKIMYIDFSGSTTDTPYQGVSGDTFKKFSEATKIDEYYDIHIKDNYEKVLLNTENTINCSLKT